jgi:type IV pilus assembly protein PilM
LVAFLLKADVRKSNKPLAQKGLNKLSLFKRKPAPVIGLDIGSASVRLLELSRAPGGYRIERFAIEPVGQGVVVEKSVEDIEAVSNAVQRAVKASGSRTKNCAIAVSGSMVYTKTISLPSNLTEADLESQVQVEANQYVPYPLDEVSLDFEILGPSTRHPDMVDILLAASKSENVQSRQDAIDTADLKAVVVDVEAFAIANAYELMRQRDGLSKSEAVGIFDIGFDLTMLLVVRNGRVIYTRDHPFGSQLLLEDIMRHYQMSAQQTAMVLRGDEPPEDFGEEVLEPFQLNIVHQISRALQFFASSNEYSPISTIYLSGGSASLQGIADLVQQELGLTTRVADPVTGTEVGPAVSHAALQRQAPNLMVAMGLALRGFD